MVRINRVGANMIANLSGSVIAAVLSLAFIPLYIRYLGIGGYGLVGFFVTLQIVFSLFNLGLGMTLVRELATMTGAPGRNGEARDLVRTLEIIYWAMAVVVGAIIAASAPYIAEYWVKSAVLPPNVVQRSITLMGIAIALQWPSALYMGGLDGLQRQVLSNWILIAMTLVRSGGAVLVLALVSPTVPAYFVWQAASGLLHTLLSGLVVWRLLPPWSERPAFRGDLLRGVFRFAAGMVGIGVMATLLTQADKVVLSKVLTLEDFGYYTLAYTVGASLYRLTSPVTTAIFPRLTQVATHEPDRLPDLYHRSAQVLSVALLPAAAVMIVFTPELLLMWTGSALTAEKASTTARLLIAGTALNGCMNMPYLVQLAHGWTSLTLTINAVAVAILIPGAYFAATHFGGVGAASIWLILNLGYVFFGVQPMYQRYLRKERMQWYVVDIGVPLAVSVVVAMTARALWIEGLSRLAQAGMIVVVSSCTLSAAALATPAVRRTVLAFLRNGYARFWGTPRPSSTHD
jgi:O-antigen/teichoic acid export membrane protein